MSSVYVRQQIKQFLADESEESVVDLTAAYEDLRQFLADSDIVMDANWLGLQFQGDDEIPISLAATNDQGLYRESGLVYMHIATTARLGAGDSILTRGETLRNLFRGRRIGQIVIESVTPINTDNGATLDFEGGYMSGSFIMGYYRDLNLTL